MCLQFALFHSCIVFNSVNIQNFSEIFLLMETGVFLIWDYCKQTCCKYLSTSASGVTSCQSFSAINSAHYMMGGGVGKFWDAWVAFQRLLSPRPGFSLSLSPLFSLPLFLELCPTFSSLSGCSCQEVNIHLVWRNDSRSSTCQPGGITQGKWQEPRSRSLALTGRGQ